MTGLMRIAQVVCTDVFAGVERYVTTLSVGLADQGCEVVVIGGSESRMRDPLGAAGVAWKPGRTVPRALAALLAERRVDVVHAHMTLAETAGVLASLRYRTPVVATRHFAQRRGSGPAARVVGRVLTGRMAAQLAISRYVADSIEGPSTVVWPGTPTQPAVDDPSAKEPVVLVAQRLEPEKRTDMALEIWARSGLAGAGWTLKVAGEGQERDHLEGLADRLGIAGSCQFLGARVDIESLHRRAAILLAPRPDEPFGLAVVEAMASSLPVVAAGGGGHLETLGTVHDAALYPVGDLDAAGRLLAEVAADPDRRKAYGRALRCAHGANFDVASQVASTLEIYRSVAPGR